MNKQETPAAPGAGGKWTPGPWKWRAVQVEGSTQLSALLLETETKPMPYSDPCVMAVREDWMGYLNGTPHGRANARLIAAAPELWEALVRVTMWAPKSTEAACEQDYEFARALLSTLNPQPAPEAGEGSEP